ncbi:MAG: hypothetical protein JWM78_2828 [Verrucomicrobiaceae bacterium]|nr:hypothetical protein [Verrucomicrobiaceae bacterium]
MSLTKIAIGSAASILLMLTSAFALAIDEFESIDVFPVEHSAGKDLSGLAFCGGELFANSDKIDDRIYALRFDQQKVDLVERMAIASIPPREMTYTGSAEYIYQLQKYANGDPLDWEDIACDGSVLYLLSERKNGILAIENNKSSWLPLDWYAAAHTAGYLNKYNAYVEGLALVDNNKILIAMERELRGLIEATRATSGQWQLITKPLNNDQQLAFREGSDDVAALALHNGFLFTLERNASAICRRDLREYRADSCFSYRHVEDDAQYRFHDHKYGLGEGLAIDNDNLYIVFDTNGDHREADSSDKRALLLKIPLPISWR